MRSWGARILPLPTNSQTAATAEDFVTALCTADIVHVHAHGNTSGIYLYKKLFGSGDLDRILASIQCRLLVLSACEAGSLSGSIGSLVYPLVQRGVQVIGATEELDDVIAVVFFSAFYESLFPRLASQGYLLSDALRDAGAACYKVAGRGRRGADVSAGIGSIVLYGNPTTFLRFRVSVSAKIKSWWLARKRVAKKINAHAFRRQHD